jgi:hypothetical protein
MLFGLPVGIFHVARPLGLRFILFAFSNLVETAQGINFSRRD